MFSRGGEWGWATILLLSFSCWVATSELNLLGFCNFSLPVLFRSTQVQVLLVHRKPKVMITFVLDWNVCYQFYGCLVVIRVVSPQYWQVVGLHYLNFVVRPGRDLFWLMKCELKWCVSLPGVTSNWCMIIFVAPYRAVAHQGNLFQDGPPFHLILEWLGWPEFQSQFTLGMKEGVRNRFVLCLVTVILVY